MPVSDAATQLRGISIIPNKRIVSAHKAARAQVERVERRVERQLDIDVARQRLARRQRQLHQVCLSRCWSVLLMFSVDVD